VTRTDCPYCDGTCSGADLTPLTTADLSWLWEQLAAKADRNGDPHLVTGTARVRAPSDPAGRAEAAGLLGGRPLARYQGRSVDLAELTATLRAHGATLTPGVVAAHATGRRLATRALERRSRDEREARLRSELDAALRDPSVASGTAPDVDHVWQALRRSGTVARLLSHRDDGPAVFRSAAAVLAALPSEGLRVDRRYLADRILDDPHGLDDGSRVGTTALALLSATGRNPSGVRARDAWNLVGVDYDELTGGLLAAGIYPAGWVLPPGAVVTLPPRELATCAWPAPPDTTSWVFVTENPSILGAAAGSASTARLLCTVGTPSALEVAAVGRLAASGWNVTVRADFDAAGLAHVTALLAGAPTARPWRMGEHDYLLTLARSPQAPPAGTVRAGHGTWDIALVDRMRTDGRAGYEETLIDELLADVATGAPSAHA